MHKRLLLTALGLVTLTAFGAVYGRLTEATPALRSSASRAAAPAPSAPVRPPSAPSSTAVDTSPEALQLAARRELYESVDALVQASEFEKARRLLDKDQQRYGDDLAPPWHDLAQSYRLIADCLEHPDPTLSVRARAFARVSEAVSLRPRILQACGTPVGAGAAKPQPPSQKLP